MARWPFLLLLPLPPALGAKAARCQAPAPSYADLPADIVWHILRQVPAPPLVAWAPRDGSGVRIVQPGAEPLEELLDGDAEDVCFFPAGGRLVTFGDRGAKIWGVRPGRPPHLLGRLRDGDGPARVIDARITPSGDRLVTLSPRGVVIVWDASSSEALRRMSWHSHRPPFIRVLDDSSFAMLGGDATDIAAVWSLDSGSVAHELRHPLQMMLLEGSACGSAMVTAGGLWDSRVFVWDVRAGRLQREFRSTGLPLHVAVAPGGVAVALLAVHIVHILTTQKELSVWDGVTGELRRRISGMESLLPGGGHAFSIDSSCAWIGDVQSGERAWVLEADVDIAPLSMYRVPVSAGGSAVAACGDWQMADRIRHQVAIWDTASGSVLSRRSEQSLHAHSPRHRSCRVAVAPTAAMADTLAT